MLSCKYIKEIGNTSNEKEKNILKMLDKVYQRMYNKKVVKGYNHTV